MLIELEKLINGKICIFQQYKTHDNTKESHLYLFSVHVPLVSRAGVTKEGKQLLSLNHIISQTFLRSIKKIYPWFFFWVRFTLLVHLDM